MELNSSIEKEFRLSPRQKTALGKLGLKTIRDLLFYFPSRYENFSERKNIINLTEGDKTTVFGEVLEASLGKTWRKKMAVSEISLGDNTGIIKAVWFHQPYMAKIITVGDKVALTGKISRNKSGIFISNPDFEKISRYEALGAGSMLLPVYSETSGVTSRWLRFAVQKILNSLEENIVDPIPEEILKKYHLPSLKSSLIFIHKPQKIKDAEAARKRLAFEEIFFIQLDRIKQKKEREKHHSLKINFDQEELEKFLSSFPFKLTGAQKNAISAVAEDMRKNFPMSRLLEGDVGSGKTAVAIAAAYLAISADYQVSYMAPTEILAGQRFQSFIEYFSHLPINIALLTGKVCKKFPSKVSRGEATNISRAQLLKWVENGEIAMIVGTHALIQKSVAFQHLAYVIVDEQHRFGTRQRRALAHKGDASPHFLSMTATPIPRTLSLTIYGDLDISLLDELPPGRVMVTTK